MKPVIVICGPTAVGKTKLSVSLAKIFDGEIINADSTQVYKELDIATAKVTKEEMENVYHHLFDIKDITEEYTVFDYQKDARKKIKEIQNRGRIPILVGGTGLYIKACLYDYQFQDEEKVTVFDNLSDEELYQKVKSLDNNTTIHPNNRKRMLRFLNYYHLHQTLLTDNKTDKLLYPTIFIGLTTSREILYERINKRVDVMVNDGLLEEAKKLYDTQIRSKAVMTPIGYKELFPYFAGDITLEVALDKVRQNCRKYAKRQYTWFKHQLPVTWVDVNFDDFSLTIAEVTKIVKSHFNDIEF